MADYDNKLLDGAGLETAFGLIKTELSAKQDTIDASHKLSPSLINTDSTASFVTATEKTTWDNKQNAIDSTHKLDPSLIDTDSTAQFVTAVQVSTWNGKQDKIDASHKLSPTLIATDASASFVTEAQVSAWDAKQDALPDSPTTDGNYKLRNSVTTAGGSQTSELSWVTDAGGGTEYQAGYGIDITGDTIALDTSYTNGVIAAISAKQDVIDSTHKLDADLVATTSSAQFVTDAQISAWTSKQDEITVANPLSPTVIATDSSAQFVTAAEKSAWSSKQDAIDSTHKLSPSLVDTDSSAQFVTAAQVSSWNDKQDAPSTQPSNDGTYKLTKTLTTEGGTQSSTLSWEVDSGGGSSLPADPSTDGTYKLRNTVTTEGGSQTATLSWETDSGGGGSSYTAGDGIDITSDVISSTAPIGNNACSFFGTLAAFDQYATNQGLASPRIIKFTASRADFYKYLRMGYWVSTGITGSFTLKDIFPELDSDAAINYLTNTNNSPSQWSNSTSATASTSIPINSNNYYFCSGGTVLVSRNYITKRLGFLLNSLYIQTTITDANNTTSANTLLGFTSKVKNSFIPDKLVSAETTPSANNTICWLYE